MKHKNCDVEHLYKDYMQSVSADPTAIDEILSGEREPANVGARIKHSTGKMVAITAAAAVLAVCTGIGLSVLNSNNNSIKPGASITDSAEPGDKTGQYPIAMKAENVQCAPHGIYMRLKLTPNSENGKEIIKNHIEKSEMKKEITLSGIKPDQTPALEINHYPWTPLIESNGEVYSTAGWYVDQLSASEDLIDYACYIPLKAAPSAQIDFVINAQTLSASLTPTQIINGYSDKDTVGSITITYKPDCEEKLFYSKQGKKMWLSDIYYARTERTDPENKLTLKYKDGSEKVITDNDFSGFYNYVFEYSDLSPYPDNNVVMNFFKENINTSDVTSVIYEGVEYTQTYPVSAETIAAAKFKSEVTQMYASDHGMIISVKLTALNDEAKTVLRLQGHDINVSVRNADNKIVYTQPGTPLPKLDEDSLTSTRAFFGNMSNGSKITDGEVLKIQWTLMSEESAGAQPPADRQLSITVKKNLTERAFKSETGKTIWLTDHYFKSDLIPSFDNDPFGEYKIRFADKTVLTDTDENNAFGGGSSDGWTQYFLEKIDSENVTSITFDGAVFKPQQGTAEQHSAIKMEAEPICVTDKAFVIEMKLTASDEQSKKLLADNTDNVMIEHINSVYPIVLQYSIKNNGLEGNTLTVYCYGALLAPIDETVTLQLKKSSTLMDNNVVSGGGKLDIRLKKNAAEKVFVSASGEQIRLTERFATTDHMHAQQSEDLHKNFPEMIFKTSGGGQVSSKDLHDAATANYAHKQVYHFWEAPKTIDIDKVTSITYDGIEFKPQ